MPNYTVQQSDCISSIPHQYGFWGEKIWNHSNNAKSPNAMTGRLNVGKSQDVYLLNLGQIDAIDKINGIQERLNNLGIDCGAVDGVLGPETKAAFVRFQEKYNTKQKDFFL